jgi:glycosyltransferase involved in cell wall biosynthesis
MSQILYNASAVQTKVFGGPGTFFQKGSWPPEAHMLKYKTMKIAIDLTQIPADKTGIGIYAVNLVREMCKLNNTSGKFVFFLFVQDDDENLIQLIKNSDKNKKSTLITVKSTVFRKLLPRFFFEQVLLPRKCRKLNVDLIYSTHYTIPYLTRIKRVVTFHDMTFYLFPELHQKIKIFYFRTLIPLSIKKSSRIITVSEATKTDMVKRFKYLKPGKMKVIHHGVDLFKENKDRSPEKYLENYGLKAKEFFLFIGTLEPRKNIISIIKAFHHVRQSSEKHREKYKLVIVGKKGWFYDEIFETVKSLHLEEMVVFTGYVSEEEKQALLLKSFLFVYPSFYEGFGIPVLEAMAGGVPVITSNVSSLPEVAGEAALLINPLDWQEIAAAMLKLLSDQRLYETLSQKSLGQAKKFSWTETAGKTMELFEEIK